MSDKLAACSKVSGDKLKFVGHLFQTSPLPIKSNTLPSCSDASLSMRYNNSMPVTSSFYTDEHILAYPGRIYCRNRSVQRRRISRRTRRLGRTLDGTGAPDEKLFLQAMIQSAVAFHHLQINRARRGAPDVSGGEREIRAAQSQSFHVAGSGRLSSAVGSRVVLASERS